MDALPGILIASSANPGPFPASYTYFMEPDGAHFAPETQGDRMKVTPC